MRLIFNHVDAWGMTFIIAVLSLVLHGALTPETLRIPAALALGAWFAFALNDRFDAPFDAHDALKARRNAFTHAASGGHLRALDALLAVVFVVLAVIYANLGARGVIAGGAGLLAAWAYSAPPLRLKTRPFFDLFMHVAFVETFPYLAAIWLAAARLTPLDIFAWVVLALASFSAQLEQQARDFDVDSQHERNFTTRVGLRTNHRLLAAASVLLLGVGVAGVALRIVPPIVWPGMAFTIPMIAHRLMRPVGAPRSERLIRMSMLVGGLYVTAVLIHAAR